MHQGYSTTVCCKFSVQRRKYCLEISIAQERLKVLDNHSIHLRYDMIFRSGLFTFYSQDLVIIVTPENFDVKEKSALKFSNESIIISD